MMILIKSTNSFVKNFLLSPLSSSCFLKYSSIKFSKKCLPKFITTPIFYVNSVPHIGHLYTTVYADALYRFSKLYHPDDELIFSTGTDEHGLKIQKSAKSQNIELSIYCDQVSGKFYQLFKSANCSFTNFIRTTDPQHESSVIKLWNILLEKGYIYKSTYSGYYSINDEAFVPENLIQTNPNGDKISIETGHKLEWHEEENYVFRLSQLQDQVIDWINNKLVMKPPNFHAALKADVKNLKNFKDISISRSRSRLNWGIKVPNDSSQLIYVWFDALTSYLTVSGYPEQIKLWPPCHVIGKDIIKFHCIYWPAFLIAAGLEPPNLLFCHSHWLYDRQKMSKSLGNVVDPFQCIENFTADGIRYFLLKEGTPHSDSNFNLDAVRTCLNADLADTLGNLLNRCTSNKLNPQQCFPRFSIDELLKNLPESEEIISNVQNLFNECYQSYSDGNFHIGIHHIMNNLRNVNSLFNIIKPWELVNSIQNKSRLDCLIYLSLEVIRVSAIFLQPIIPNISESIFQKLQIPIKLCTWKSAEEVFSSKLMMANNDRNQISSQKLIIFTKI